jgi:hypothetical protein
MQMVGLYGETMHLPHELKVVLLISAELEGCRVKMLGHPRDVSLVESYFRNRIADLVEISETCIEREWFDPRPLTPNVVGADEKN